MVSSYCTRLRERKLGHRLRDHSDWDDSVRDLTAAYREDAESAPRYQMKPLNQQKKKNKFGLPKFKFGRNWTWNPLMSSQQHHYFHNLSSIPAVGEHTHKFFVVQQSTSFPEQCHWNDSTINIHHIKNIKVWQHVPCLDSHCQRRLVPDADPHSFNLFTSLTEYWWYPDRPNVLCDVTSACAL